MRKSCLSFNQLPPRAFLRIYNVTKHKKVSKQDRLFYNKELQIKESDPFFIKINLID